MNGVIDAGVQLVADHSYLQNLKWLIDQAVKRVYCSIFMIDLFPGRDYHLTVDTVLLNMQAAVWRGVDVKILIGGSRSNYAIAESAVLATKRLKRYEIPHDWITSSKTRGSHSKIVIVDDFLLTGSHNWSGGAFEDQTQDSVLVYSKSMTALLANDFLSQWSKLKKDAGV